MGSMYGVPERISSELSEVHLSWAVSLLLATCDKWRVGFRSRPGFPSCALCIVRSRNYDNYRQPYLHDILFEWCLYWLSWIIGCFQCLEWIPQHVWRITWNIYWVAAHTIPRRGHCDYGSTRGFFLQYIRNLTVSRVSGDELCKKLESICQL